MRGGLYWAGWLMALWGTAVEATRFGLFNGWDGNGMELLAFNGLLIVALTARAP